MIRICILFLCLISSTISQAQRIATLEVEQAKLTQGLDIPVSIELDDVTLLPENVDPSYKGNGFFSLHKRKSRKHIVVLCRSAKDFYQNELIL